VVTCKNIAQPILSKEIAMIVRSIDGDTFNAKHQTSRDDKYDVLELFAEEVYIFLSLLAIQRRLGCDELWVFERAVKVMALIRPDANVPLFRHADAQ
jgi:hypothetical protein